MAYKPKLIVVDGCDRVGKSSTLQAVWRARGKIDTCIDRGIISNMVYNKIYKRDIDDSWYMQLLPDEPQVYYFVFFASVPTIIQRMKATGHELIDENQLAKEQDLFVEYYQKLKSFYLNAHFYFIDTTWSSQEEVVQEVLKILER